jgi:peptidyl-prolyl cis-trans isomerase A (cyclophilin A)
MMTFYATGLLALGLLSFAGVGAGGQDESPSVEIDTSLGKIVVELDAKSAPTTVANFLKYVDDGFYDGTIFHRVIPGFMIQGGGVTPDMREKPTRAPIKNESGNGLSNTRGTIAMARTNDPNSATSQFFINVANNEQLDNYGGGYAVFGKVTSGMDVADKIVNVRTTTRAGQRDVPAEPVVIKTIRRAARP